ncbi:MAG: RraA family protein [Symbiobacteriia bacterium]
MPVGARIRASFPRPDQATLAAFAGVSASDAADAQGRLAVVDPAIRRMSGQGTLVGPALPVLCRPDDNLMIHAAIDLAQPGDVIIISAGGGTQTALVGELVSSWAKACGVAGFVIDGAVRDVEALQVPTFARGASPRAPFKAAPGEVGFPVGLGGVAVAPGDIVIADADGVVIVPQAEAAEVLGRLAEIRRAEQAAKDAMSGGTYDRAWVRQALEKAGVENV